MNQERVNLFYAEEYIERGAARVIKYYVDKELSQTNREVL